MYFSYGDATDPNHINIHLQMLLPSLMYEFEYTFIIYRYEFVCVCVPVPVELPVLDTFDKIRHDFWCVVVAAFVFSASVHQCASFAVVHSLLFDTFVPIKLSCVPKHLLFSFSQRNTRVASSRRRLIRHKIYTFIYFGSKGKKKFYGDFV